MNTELKLLAIALAITFGLTTQARAQHHGGSHAVPHGHGLGGHGHGGHGFGGHHSPGHFGSSGHSPSHHGGHGHGGHGFGGHHSPSHFGSSGHSPSHHGGHGGHGGHDQHFTPDGHDHHGDEHGHHGDHGFGGDHSHGHLGSLWHNPFHHEGDHYYSDPYEHRYGDHGGGGFFDDGHGHGNHGGHGFGSGFLSFLPGLFGSGLHNPGADRYSDSRYYSRRGSELYRNPFNSGLYNPGADRYSDSDYYSRRGSELYRNPLNPEHYRPRSTYQDLMRAGSDYFSNGDYRSASRAFVEAISLRPNEPVPKFSLGHALFALGEYDQAAYAIRRGLSIFPNWVRIRMNRRDFYSHPGDFDSQLTDLKYWSEQRPNNVSAKFLLGYNYYFSEQKEKAYYAFRDALSLDPNDRYSKYFLDEIDLSR